MRSVIAFMNISNSRSKPAGLDFQLCKMGDTFNCNNFEKVAVLFMPRSFTDSRFYLWQPSQNLQNRQSSSTRARDDPFTQNHLQPRLSLLHHCDRVFLMYESHIAPHHLRDRVVMHTVPYCNVSLCTLDLNNNKLFFRGVIKYLMNF